MKFEDLNVLGGLHSPDERRLLYDLALDVQADEAIVEIGSYVGASTLALAFGAKAGHGAHVTCIDPWPAPLPDEKDEAHAERQRNALQFFMSNMDAASWPVTALRARSQDIWRMWLQPIGLLFIDGDHSFEAVDKDLEWIVRLAPGGVMVMHDYLGEQYEETDVARALEQWECNFAETGIVDRTWWGRLRWP